MVKNNKLFKFIVIAIFCIVIAWIPCTKNRYIKSSQISMIESNKNSVFCCVDSIIKSNANNRNTIFKRSYVKMAVENNALILHEEIGKKIFNNSTVKSWVKLADLDSIKIYDMNIKQGKKYYLLSSPISQATGLAINITQWLIIEVDNSNAYSFKSIIDNVGLFYYNGSSKCLNATIIDFSDEFIIEKDYDNISFKMTKIEINNGAKKTLKQSVSHCRCK